MNALSVLSAHSYQSVLSRSGNAGQAPGQASGTSFSPGASTSTQTPPLITPVDRLDATQADRTEQPAPSAAAGRGTDSQALAGAFLGSHSSALPPASDSLPASAAALSPATAEAVARYAYDQSRNPDSTSHLFNDASSQLSMAQGLNLLA